MGGGKESLGVSRLTMGFREGQGKLERIDPLLDGSSRRAEVADEVRRCEVGLVGGCQTRREGGRKRRTGSG